MKPFSVNKESYSTTGEFSKVCTVYKHCGPTAITNVLLSLGARGAAEDIFRVVVALGKRRGFYVSLKKTKRLGGTSDFLAGLYLRLTLKKYGLSSHKVRFGGVARSRALAKALDEGKIIYLALHFHPKYHNHHLLLYAQSKEGFRAADGWSKTPVVLSARDVRCALFYTIN